VCRRIRSDAHRDRQAFDGLVVGVHVECAAVGEIAAQDCIEGSGRLRRQRLAGDRLDCRQGEDELAGIAARDPDDALLAATVDAGFDAVSEKPFERDPLDRFVGFDVSSDVVSIQHRGSVCSGADVRTSALSGLCMAIPFVTSVRGGCRARSAPRRRLAGEPAIGGDDDGSGACGKRPKIRSLAGVAQTPVSPAFGRWAGCECFAPHTRPSPQNQATTAFRLEKTPDRSATATPTEPHQPRNCTKPANVNCDRTGAMLTGNHARLRDQICNTLRNTIPRAGSSHSR